MADKAQIGIPSQVCRTAAGTSYLKKPGVSCLAVPEFYASATASFINGFDEFNGDEYMRDMFDDNGNTKFAEGELLAKFAGQLCYMSFGEGRTKTNELPAYMTNIKSSGHGSVLEHVNVSLLLYGIDRAMTHELVRHRAGFAYSQLSQRYVSGKLLRFVERDLFQKDPALHAAFEQRIDDAAARYDALAEMLMKTIDTSGLSRTEARKKVNQAARSCLPNETEAPVVVTANVRAWRHFLDQRGSKWADEPACSLAVTVFKVLKHALPVMFDDIEEVKLDDGRTALEAKYRKV